jgi:hypothetical protein
MKKLITGLIVFLFFVLLISCKKEVTSDPFANNLITAKIKFSTGDTLTFVAAGYNTAMGCPYSFSHTVVEGNITTGSSGISYLSSLALDLADCITIAGTYEFDCLFCPKYNSIDIPEDSSYFNRGVGQRGSITFTSVGSVAEGYFDATCKRTITKDSLHVSVDSLFISGTFKGVFQH